jgi:predicted dehydrogenase
VVGAGVRPASEIGAAVIGSGFIGTVHVEALRRLGIQVHGILGSSPERAANRARQLGVARGYGSLGELLADERVEVVHVTSPNHLHHPQVVEILDAGRHVVCEKPLAMTANESADLAERAARSGKVNAVNFNIRFYPLNQHAHELVAAGELGQIRLVTGRYFQDWLLLETDWNWRLEPDRGGALRAVGDIGSHWLDLMTFITGQRITSVMADLATFIQTRRQPADPIETFSTERSAETVEREIATEDTAAILLRFEAGARGSVAISQLSPGRKNSLQYEIDGSSAAASWDSEQPDQMWIGHRDRANEILIRNPALMGAAGQAAAALPGGHVEGFADTFRALFRAIYADVGNGGPSRAPTYPTFADGHDEMLVNDAIAASARDGRWTDVVRAQPARPMAAAAETIR